MTTEGRQASVDRRAVNAAETRRAIVDAARRLFAERGYWHTRIDDVAGLARVSPATVYAQCGGKQGLLRSVMTMWAADGSLDSSVQVAVAQSTAEEMLLALTERAAQEVATWGDVMHVVHQAAAQEPEAVAFLTRRRELEYQALVELVARLRGTGRLLGSDEDEIVVDKIRFHLRHQQLALLIDDCGWPMPAAVSWAAERLQATLLAMP